MLQGQVHLTWRHQCSPRPVSRTGVRSSSWRTAITPSSLCPRRWASTPSASNTRDSTYQEARSSLQSALSLMVEHTKWELSAQVWREERSTNNVSNSLATHTGIHKVKLLLNMGPPSIKATSLVWTFRDCAEWYFSEYLTPGMWPCSYVARKTRQTGF